MKQKTANDIPVTKSVLQKELKKELKKALSNYVTKDDLHKALNNHPTKDDLKKVWSNYPTKINVEMMLEKSEMRTDERARQYRDDVLTKMDEVVGELAQLREDRLFEKHEKKEFQEQIDDPEKRIKKIEGQSN